MKRNQKEQGRCCQCEEGGGWGKVGSLSQQKVKPPKFSRAQREELEGGGGGIGEGQEEQRIQIALGYKHIFCIHYSTMMRFLRRGKAKKCYWHAEESTESACALGIRGSEMIKNGMKNGRLGKVYIEDPDLDRMETV